MAGGEPKRIDLTLVGLALNLVTALVLIAVAYGAFKGSSESQAYAVQKQLDRLESRVDRVEARIR